MLSTPQAGPGRNFSQPRVRLIVEPCTLYSFQVSLPELLDQLDTELRLLKEELRQHKQEQQHQIPAPNYAAVDQLNEKDITVLNEL